MKTLKEFQELINNSDEWKLEFYDIIDLNQWENECDGLYGICNDGKERLQFNEKGKAEIIDINDFASISY